MSETDLKKRDLLKTLPVAPALLLGGAAGLTATPAHAQHPVIGFAFFVIGRATVWQLVSLGCEVVEAINEGEFMPLNNLRDYIRDVFRIDDGHEALDRLDEIGGDGEAMVTQVSDSEDNVSYIAITSSHLVVFVA